MHSMESKAKSKSSNLWFCFDTVCIGDTSNNKLFAKKKKN